MCACVNVYLFEVGVCVCVFVRWTSLEGLRTREDNKEPSASNAHTLPLRFGSTVVINVPVPALVLDAVAVSSILYRGQMCAN